MEIERSKIEGVALLRWPVSEDHRGQFARTFCRTSLAAAGFRFEIVQANLVRNKAVHTLRGMHLQSHPHGEAKIISCVRGRIWQAVADLREWSDGFGTWDAFELGPESNASVHVPPGVASGYLTLEPETELHYLMDAPYVPASATGVRWDDASLAIGWPALPQAVSARDRQLPLLDAHRGIAGTGSPAA